MLVALVAIGAVLRLATLDLQSFDFDEAYTVGIVLDGSLGDALAALPRTESTPPLFYVLAWIWSRAFGLGEVGVRSLPALVGIALIPVAFGAARELAGRRAGLVAAAFVAVSPQLVFYSQEARAYSLLALLSTLSFWAFLLALRGQPSHALVIWSLTSAGALLTHYFAAFLVGPEAVWLIAARRPRLPAVLAAAGPLAVGLALLPLALDQSDGRTDWISDSPLSERIREVAKKSVTGEYDPTSNLHLVLVAAIVMGGVAYSLAHADRRERRGFALALSLAGIALSLPLIIDLTARELLVAKNVVLVLPLVAVALGCALGSRASGGIGIASAALACTFLAVITVVPIADPRLRRPDYRGAAKSLGRPAPDVAVLTPFHGSAPLSVYVPGATPVPATGVTVRELVLVEPLTRADAHEPERRPPPSPPHGFTRTAREEHDTFTITRYGADPPTSVTPAIVAPLAPGTTTFPAVLLTWPPSG